MSRLVLLTLVLSLGACSPNEAPLPVEAPVAPPAIAPTSTAGAPPTIGGLYVAKNVCPGEGCYLAGKIKAYEGVDLFDKAGAGAAAVGRVEAGEWVEIVSREEHLAPVRGVVREGRKHFAAGDVVYLLSSQGEGCYDVWSKGAVGSWCDPEAVGDAAVDEVIDFDAPAAVPVGAGLWVEVRRDAGAGGWLRGTEKFGCTGYQDRDADCPPLPK